MSADIGVSPAGCLVKVTSLANGGFAAEPPGAPELRSEGATRADALDEVRRRIADGLANGGFALVTANGFGTGFGHARNDPDFHEYLAEIRRYREERDRSEFASDESAP